MAKNTKGGLGRGLNSLLGSSLDEGLTSEVSSRRVLVENDEKTTPDKENVSPKTVDQEPVIKEVKTRIVEPKPSEDSNVEDTPRSSLEQVIQRESLEVPLSNIEPNPHQPRTNFKSEDLEELAESIKKDGLLQPILVRPTEDNKYQIIAGERRWQACCKVGLKSVPVRIKDADDNRSLELALVENLQRSDLNPIEEAYGYRRLMERGNKTQSEVAQIMSKGRSTVANALRLLELPEEAQQLLYEEKITAGHARAILSVNSVDGRKKLTEKLLSEKLSVRETEALARLMNGRDSAEAKPRTPLPKSYKTVARALRESLGTNVRVKSVKGKNKIEIEFKDEDDLQRLFNVIAEGKQSQ